MTRGFARDVLISVLGNISAPLVGLIIAPILAQELGVAGRGEVAASTAPVIFAVAIGIFGMAEAATYFAANSRYSVGSVLRLSSCILAVLGVLASVAIFKFANVLADGGTQLAYLIGICGIAAAPTIMLGGVRGIASGLQLWGTIAAERYVVNFARLLGVATFAIVGQLDVASAALVISFAPVLGAIVYIWPIMRLGSAIGSMPVRLTGLTSFGARLWLGSVAGIILTRLDQTVLTPLVGVVELGLYAAAVNLADVPLMVSQAARDVLLSSDVKRPSIDRALRASRAATWITIVMSIGIFGGAYLLIDRVFGYGFSGALPALAVLLGSCVVSVPGSIAGSVLVARGRPHLRSLAIVAAVPLNLVALYLLAPRLGAEGAAIATLLGAVVASGLTMTFAKRVAELGFLQMVRPRLADARLVSDAVLSRVRGRDDR